MVFVLATLLVCGALGLHSARSGLSARGVRVSPARRRWFPAHALALALCLLPVSTSAWAKVPGEAPAQARAATTPRAATPDGAGRARPPGAQYAAREAQTGSVEKFEGGDTVVVFGGGALVIILIVVLIVVLI